MKLISLVFLFFVSAFSFAADDPKFNASVPALSAPSPAPDVVLSPRFQKDIATVSFSKVNLSDFIALVYGEVFQTPYVLDPSVVSDQRVISTRLEISKKSHSQLKALFESLDLVVEKKNGVDLISMRDVPYGKDQEVHLYFPKYRDSVYLADLLRGLFAGSFTTSQHSQPAIPVQAPSPTLPAQGQPQSQQQTYPQGQSGLPPVQSGFVSPKVSGVLVFTGTAKEISKLKKILPQVDTKQGEVVLRATVYEVSTSVADGSGFQLALNLLSSKIQLTLGDAPVSSQAISFKTPAIDAVFSALASDGRFKTISSPSIRVRSGAAGRFFAGQTVRVPGSVSYPPGGGTPVQSIEQLSSGVTFEVSPVVHESTIDLTVMQQVSSFSGVSSPSGPTILNREISTSLSLTDGEVVVIGGLSDSKETDTHSGLSFLPSFFHSTAKDTSQADIILVLQLKKL